MVCVLACLVLHLWIVNAYLMKSQADEVITLDVSNSGKMFAKSQVTDYRCRGTELQEYNLIEFFTDTYEVDITKADREAELVGEDVHRGPGRPRNRRVRYLTTHPKSGSVHRIIRSAGHRNLPNFLGRWFPRNDDPDTYEFYCACMLLLLKPWRDIAIDLKPDTETWASTFEEFRLSTQPNVHRILSGIQYFHECESAAHAEGTRSYVVPTNQSLDDESGVDEVPTAPGLSEEGLALLKMESVPLREEQHGRMAIEIAKHLGIFRNEQGAWPIEGEHTPANATEDDLSRISMWSSLLQAAVDEKNNRRGSDLPPAPSTTATIERSLLLEDGSPSGSSLPAVILQTTGSEQALPAVDLGSLKRDQLRAYQIVDWHLGETLRGTSPPPLRMILYGEGGTGKSRVIQTITESFAARGVGHMLIKAAYTGVAASLISGKTTHVIAGLSLGCKRGVTDASKKKLQDFWREVQYLIIDEYSMLSKTFLATLSRNISIGMEGAKGFRTGHSFGGLNVILCGDLHQFPPVACSRREALYYPLDTNDSMDAQVGRQTYDEFSTVVILKEQIRISDPTWRDFLEHLRYGRVESRHLDMLRTLLLKRGITGGKPPHSPNDLNAQPPTSNLPMVDFSTQPWADAALITPRHAVRTQWNEAASQKRCSETGQRLFICPALDTIKGTPLTLKERYALANRYKHTKRRRNKDLPDSILLAIGMKVMVTNNLQTDLDITNGARGVITDIILNQDEPLLEDGSTIQLKFLPQCILVKLSHTRAATLPHLEEGVIPIQRVTSHMQIKVDGKSRTVTRTQFPITGADSFTDYRAQGQTIPYVIIDIAPPPTSGLSLFNLYVSLSRSSGRGTIRLLRDFDDEMFLQAHELELIDEDERLERMDLVTKEWWDRVQGE